VNRTNSLQIANDMHKGQIKSNLQGVHRYDDDEESHKHKQQPILETMVIMMTYSRGFFFGPGFPRALGAPSMACPSDLFVPAFAPPPFFFGGSVAPGAGVALLSEASPLFEDAGAVTAAWPPVGVDADDGVDFTLEFF
jgi:hypothetical protein